MRVSTTRLRHGSAKVNLLIAIIVVGLAVALIITAVRKTREAEARTQSINNLKQIGLGMQSFHDGNKNVPFNGADFTVGTANYKTEADLNRSPITGSWGFQILPYTISLMHLWPKVREIELWVLYCPGRGRPKREDGKGAWSDYFINNYLNYPDKAEAPDNPRARRNFDDITDGVSNTIFAGHGNLATGDYGKTREVVGCSNIFLGGTWGTARAGPNWKLGAPLHVELRRDSAEPPDFTKGGWGGPFPQGGLFVFCDGTVRTLPYSMSGEVFAALLTPTGEDKIGLAD